MIYVIFDTNIWIYLANGFDSEKADFNQGVYSEHHFDLLDALKEKSKDSNFKILVNKLIFDEWLRNKKATEDLIKVLKKKESAIVDSAKLINAFASQDDIIFIKEIVDRVRSKINEKIKKNKQHIEDVEKFLKNNCFEIPISQTVINKVSDFAVNKNVAPFLRNKNNVADAIILYSAVEFLEKNLLEGEGKGIFVSNNYIDFASNDNKDEFHHDIQFNIRGVELTYERHLKKVIGLSEYLQEDIEYYLDLKKEILEKSHFYCETLYCHDDKNINQGGYFDKKIRYRETIEDFVDPKQLRLFPLQPLDKMELESLKLVPIGICDICETTHLKCPECSNIIIDIESMNEFFCNECEVFYELKFSQRNRDQYIVKRTNENF